MKEKTLYQNISGFWQPGVRKKPEELLFDEGIDITKESFWQKGFDLVNEKITELKTIN